MSQTPDALAREWFAQVWNQLDESAIDRLMHPEGLVHGLGPEPLRGPDQFKPFFHTFRNALGGIRVDITRTVVQGDTCAVLCRVVATHVGHTLGAPATNRDVDVTGITMLRVKDGRIVEGWNVFDFLTMYQQIGWVANPVLPASC
jgi:predicted ester cyclase